MTTKRIAMIYCVAMRYMAKEFPSQEALDAYLEEHPKADPKNHTVTKKTKKKQPLVSAKEESLPTSVRQKVSSPDELFALADGAHKASLSWLNQGKGLDSVIGASVVRADKGEKPDFDGPGPIIVIGPPKKKERAKEKVDSDYDGDYSQLLDIVRASVAVDSMDQLESVMQLLRKSGMKVAKKPKNRFANPTDVGYRDLMLNVEYPNGLIGELQLHLKPILIAKAEGHKDYEVLRSIGANAKKEGRTEMTEKEQEQVDKARENMMRLYNQAWERSIAPMKKTANLKEYYLYNDQPAIWEKGKFPVRAKNKKPVYDLDTFIEGAVRIDKKTFDQHK